MDSKKIQTLLSQEINRKQFLTYIGAVFLSVIGIKGLMKNLVTNHPHYQQLQTSQPGYGFGDYGNKSSLK